MEDFADILYEMGMNSDGIEALAMILGFVTVGLVIGLVVGLVLYVLKAVGLYSMAKRRNVGGAWLAWIPIGQYWVAGAIADQYKKTVKGKSSSNRIIMLVLALLGWVVSGIAGSVMMSSLIQMLTAIVNEDVQELSYIITVLSGSSSLVSMLSSGLSIALLVFWQISLYNIYASSCPKHSVLFLILGIFFEVTVPFFLFCNRKKDEGMKVSQPVAQPAYDYGNYDNYQY